MTRAEEKDNINRESTQSVAVAGGSVCRGDAPTLGGEQPASKSLRILALDMATRTGWALWDGSRMESGVQDFSPQRGESPGMRYLYFNRWLSDMALEDDHPILACRTKHRVDLIWYEQNFRRGGHASEVAAGFTTRVHELCAGHGIEYGQLNAMTLKKWATGSGKADKEAMKIAAVIRKHRQVASDVPALVLKSMATLMDDNEADSILLLAYAMEKFLGEKEWNAQPAAAGAAK